MKRRRFERVCVSLFVLLLRFVLVVFGGGFVLVIFVVVVVGRSGTGDDREAVLFIVVGYGDDREATLLVVPGCRDGFRVDVDALTFHTDPT